ncbi:MAG: response regulator transcription factor [Pseudomonadota bacterium]
MNILLVEDENRVANFISRGLKSEGWSVEVAQDGETALAFLEDRSFGVVILDLMLPGISGQDVCRKMRARKNLTPVLMLTALDATDERVEGLTLGADDYLPKPFDFEELVARVFALSRRASNFALQAAEERLEYEGLCLDTRSLTVFVDDMEIDVTARERDILTLFMSNVGKVYARERILNAIWGSQDDPLTNVVDVYVGRLRKKLGTQGDLIHTVRGVGYRFGS